jgi:hypothetical protein
MQLLQASAIALTMALGGVFLTGAIAAESPVEQSVADLAKRCDRLADDNNWSNAEKFTWRRICKGQAADFNQEEDYHGPLDPLSDDGWSDGKRTIGKDFLEHILTRPPFSDILKDQIIQISGAYFNETITLSNIVARAFTISKSRFLDIFIISKVDVKYFGLEANYIGGRLGIELGSVRQLDLKNNTVAAGVAIKNLIADMVNYTESNDSLLWIEDLRTPVLSCCGNVGQILITRSRIEDLGDFSTSGNLQSLEFSASWAGSLNFTRTSSDLRAGSSKGLWVDHSKLDLSNSNVGIIALDQMPSSISVDNFEFRIWDFGDKPHNRAPQLEGQRGEELSGVSQDTQIPRHQLYQLIDKIDNSKIGSKIAMLQKLSDQYRKQGNFRMADDLLYQKRNEETGNEGVVNQIFGLISREIVGYGVKLQNGLILIVVFTLIGYVIFKTGWRDLESGSRPRSWLVFSIDAIIPGINLDDEHKKIKFEGWRQYYLYFLKALGILLFFLFLRYVSQALVGNI